MFYKDYEEYMKNILGCKEEKVDKISDNKCTYNTNNVNNTSELEKFYPKIYIKLNPIILEYCHNIKSIDNDNIQNIVNNVYLQYKQSIITNERNINVNNIYNKNRDIVQNELLYKDLIKILVLKELINRKEENYNIIYKNSIIDDKKYPFEFYKEVL